MADSYQAPVPVLTGDTRSPKPQAVTNGVLLHYIAYGLSAIGVVTSLTRTATTAPQIPIGAVLFGAALFLALFTWIATTAGQGKNWARITLLVIFLVFVPFAGIGIVTTLSVAPLNAVISLAQQILEAVGLYFLFSGPASAWYKTNR